MNCLAAAAAVERDNCGDCIVYTRGRQSVFLAGSDQPTDWRCTILARSSRGQIDFVKKDGLVDGSLAWTEEE